MGWGDEIMATAYARRQHNKFGGKVAVVDQYNKRRTSAVWENNPIIANTKVERAGARVTHAPGCRPYIDYGQMPSDIKQARNFVWGTEKLLGPGEIYFSEDETKPLVSGHYVLIEPNVKGNPNKDWGFERFQAVVNAIPYAGFAQCDYGAPLLEGVATIKTKDFRQALRVVRDAQAVVCPEGGIHHAAAALGKPAVVIFGGFISPKITGYDSHTNLFAGSGAGCGMRVPCNHCVEAMAAITPEIVVDAVRAILDTEYRQDGKSQSL